MGPAVPWITPDHVDVAAAAGLQIRLGGVPRGGVVVIPAVGGLHSDATTAMNRLAEHGYESVAADVSELAAPADGVDSASALLAGRGWRTEQVGLVGYGPSGAAAVLEAAMTHRFGAAVSIAPTWSVRPQSAFSAAIRHAGRIRTPWLGLFGEDTPACEVTQLTAALDARAPVFTRAVRYPGVVGAFYRDVADAHTHAAAFDAWQRTVEWLNARVVPRPTALAEIWRRRQAFRPTE